jgi:hypothetical protein
MWDIGRRDEARDKFVDALRLRNRYSIYPKTCTR